MAPLLHLEDIAVTVGREKMPAVKSLSLGLEAGEIAGIAGESGCGKSLTALSIAGLLPPQADIAGGSIVFDGRELRNLDEDEYRKIRARDISMIFQEPSLSLNPLIRAGDQIAGALLSGADGKAGNRAERRAAERTVLDLLARLGFEDPKRAARSFPFELSGGMCQRVMIALAMIRRPRLLIADEPTTALDVVIQAQILDLMKKINRESGTAILLISHDLRVIRAVTRRVFVMYAGRIVESGPAGDVFEDPLHPYTKALLGAIPEREKKGKALAAIPGRVPVPGGGGDGCPFAPRCARAARRCAASFPPETVRAGGRGDIRGVRCFFPEAGP